MAYKWMRFLFAVSGDRTAIPGPVDVSGNVSYEQGYGPDYQRPKTDPLSKNIERDKMNALFYDLTGNVQYWQQNSMPAWVDPVDNGGVAVSYPAGAVVRYVPDGKVYVSAIAANVSIPGVNTNWFEAAGRVINVRVFTANTSFTPTPGTKAVDAFVQAGGGGGGAAQSTGAGQMAAGAGGGGGGWARKRITAGFAGASIVVGAGGAIGNGGNGGAGGNSSFGAFISAVGGAGGSFGFSGPTGTVSIQGSGPGGTASGGDYNGTGEGGLYAVYNAVTPTSGRGGGSYFGGGPNWVTTSAALNGASLGIPFYGTGGSGGACGVSQPGAATGGAGVQGVCIVVEYA